MIKVSVIPRIVIIGMMVMIFGAVLSFLAYIFETQVLGMTPPLPLYELFADAFKVGLGAFIGVLSQWASRVFDTEADKKQEPTSRPADVPAEQPAA